jgi:hypothetical protein
MTRLGSAALSLADQSTSDISLKFPTFQQDTSQQTADPVTNKIEFKTSEESANEQHVKRTCGYRGKG